jgi:hypothetical protein
MIRFQSGHMATVIDREPALDKSGDTLGSRIRCPLCGWSPSKESRWFCGSFHEYRSVEYVF